MSAIFGSLNIADSDRVFASTVGQEVIYEAVAAYVSRVNAELAAAMSVFVERTTDRHTLRYKLPGGGYLQRRGSQARPGTVKATGSWDVALPLEDFGAALGWNDVDRAYMTVEELDRHVSTVVAQNINTVRYELLRALLSNTPDLFPDPLHGALTVQPLANGDAVLYPPVLGADSEATDDHYLESGYLPAAISDVNNPFPVIADELNEHFGESTGNDNLVIFISPADAAAVMALTDFVEVPDQFIRAGSATAVPEQLPSVPGKIIGRMAGRSGAWVSMWRYLPDHYMLGLRLDVPPPLLRRIDPPDTGLGDGLQLVAADANYPFAESIWRHRFGLGVGNRLNGVVMEIAAGGGYTVPAGF